MGHLNEEALARLVDEAPTGTEAEHLRACTECSSTLEAFRRQTEALEGLPALRPPPGGWAKLQARLEAEGLVEPGHRSEHRRPGARSGLPRSGWFQAAAAIVLFLAGTGVGTLTTGAGDAPGRADGGAASGPDGAAPGSPVVEASATSPITAEAAAARLLESEEEYLDALVSYRQLLEASDGAPPGYDATSRFAALETLVAASQAAVREAPADPFLNGVLASTVAERRAALEQMSTDDETWF